VLKPVRSVVSIDSKRRFRNELNAMYSPSNKIEIPKVRLPKGGGSIKGIGETFQATPFTGAGSFSIPIKTPAARGLEPDLKLSYSSGGSQ